MKTEPEDPLLNAVLEKDDDFRAQTLHQTLALAKRRRWWRTAQRSAVAAAVLLCVAIFLRQPAPVPTAALPKRGSGLEIVRTMPLPAHAIVQNRSTSFTNVSTSPGSFAIVRSGPVSLEYLDNAHLLALLRDYRAALVGLGSPDVRVVRY